MNKFYYIQKNKNYTQQIETANDVFALATVAAAAVTTTSVLAAMTVKWHDKSVSFWSVPGRKSNELTQNLCVCVCVYMVGFFSVVAEMDTHDEIIFPN